jgi:hypothetical protein
MRSAPEGSTEPVGLDLRRKTMKTLLIEEIENCRFSNEEFCPYYRHSDYETLCKLDNHKHKYKPSMLPEAPDSDWALVQQQNRAMLFENCPLPKIRPELT